MEATTMPRISLKSKRKRISGSRVLKSKRSRKLRMCRSLALWRVEGILYPQGQISRTCSSKDQPGMHLSHRYIRGFSTSSSEGLDWSFCTKGVVGALTEGSRQPPFLLQARLLRAFDYSDLPPSSRAAPALNSIPPASRLHLNSSQTSHCPRRGSEGEDALFLFNLPKWMWK